jgi:hypothetical protein
MDALLQALISGGPVAILAYIIYLTSEKARREQEESHRKELIRLAEEQRMAYEASEKRLSKIIDADQRTREEYTRLMTELTTLIRELRNKE